MGREAIGKVIAYLNSANEGAQKNGYIWNVYTNNCSHLAHNALAAAGVWDAKAARGPGAIELARDLLGVANTLEQGWISTGPGALIVSYPMHDKARNRMFSAGRDPFLFSVPVLWDKRNEFKELTRKIPAMLTDLGANLAYFHAALPGRSRTGGA